MKPLSVLATPIYQSLSKQYPNLSERREATKKYILNEITHWTIKSAVTPSVYSFKPVEFKGTSDSTPFEVRLVYDENTDFWELKFGNLNAPSDKEKFNWDDNDPNRLSKALFLTDVINKEIIPMLKSDEISGIQFHPYNADGLGDDRFSYFRNMFDKLGKNNFNLEYDDESESYYIVKK